jgi:hypothetical protein
VDSAMRFTTGGACEILHNHNGREGVRERGEASASRGAGSGVRPQASGDRPQQLRESGGRFCRQTPEA